MMRFIRQCGFIFVVVVIAAFWVRGADAAVIQYTGYGDLLSTTITSDVGSAIDGSANFTENGSFGFNTVAGLGVGSPGPMTFSAFTTGSGQAFEVGMTFGNDQSCCSSTGVFDVTLTIFAGVTNLGSVHVTSNGNDLEDQFIGLVSTVAFDTITLNYANPSSGTLTRFISRIDIGYDNVNAVPLPAALPLFATGLGLMGLLGWRRKRKAVAAGEAKSRGGILLRSDLRAARPTVFHAPLA